MGTVLNEHIITVKPPSGKSASSGPVSSSNDEEYAAPPIFRGPPTDELPEELPVIMGIMVIVVVFLLIVMLTFCYKSKTEQWTCGENGQWTTIPANDKRSQSFYQYPDQSNYSGVSRATTKVCSNCHSSYEIAAIVPSSPTSTSSSARIVNEQQQQHRPHHHSQRSHQHQHPPSAHQHHHPQYPHHYEPVRNCSISTERSSLFQEGIFPKSEIFQS